MLLEFMPKAGHPSLKKATREYSGFKGSILLLFIFLTKCLIFSKLLEQAPCPGL